MPRKTTDIIFRAVFVVLLGVVVTREVWHPNLTTSFDVCVFALCLYGLHDHCVNLHRAMHPTTESMAQTED